MSNKVDSSIYGSLSSTNPDVLHLIVLNKNQNDSINGTFTITSSRNYTSGDGLGVRQYKLQYYAANINQQYNKQYIYIYNSKDDPFTI